MTLDTSDRADVTETLVDLAARIATQQASLARVRELLARATTIGEIVSLENELTNRQAELDSLMQRREKLSGLVALATITVVLEPSRSSTRPKPAAPSPAVTLSAMPKRRISSNPMPWTPAA